MAQVIHRPVFQGIQYEMTKVVCGGYNVDVNHDTEAGFAPEYQFYRVRRWDGKKLNNALTAKQAKIWCKQDAERVSNGNR